MIRNHSAVPTAWLFKSRAVVLVSKIRLVIIMKNNLLSIGTETRQAPSHHLVHVQRAWKWQRQRGGVFWVMLAYTHTHTIAKKGIRLKTLRPRPRQSDGWTITQLLLKNSNEGWSSCVPTPLPLPPPLGVEGVRQKLSEVWLLRATDYQSHDHTTII